MKVTKLVDIATSALFVSEMSVSKVLNNGEIDEWEFGMLQTLYSKSLNELTDVHHKMEAENRNQLQKSLLDKINEIKNTLRTSAL